MSMSNFGHPIVCTCPTPTETHEQNCLLRRENTIESINRPLDHRIFNHSTNSNPIRLQTNGIPYNIATLVRQATQPPFELSMHSVNTNMGMPLMPRAVADVNSKYLPQTITSPVMLNPNKTK